MTPDAFWDSDPLECLMVINGYQERVNDLRETLAHFVTPLLNVQRGKKGRKIKPSDLFSRPKKQQEKREESESEHVIAAKRRELMREWKTVSPPKRGRKHRPHQTPPNKP